MTLSDDGSGKGAAMVACVADRSLSNNGLERDEEATDYEQVNKHLLI
jgi:hypothetical protein